MKQLKPLVVLAATAISISPLDRAEAWSAQKGGDLENNGAFLSPEWASRDDPEGPSTDVAFAGVEASTTVGVGADEECVVEGVSADAAASKTIMIVKMITSVDQCQKLCATASQCAGANYDAKEKACELLSSVSRIKTDLAKTFIFGSCSTNCFEKNRRGNGDGEKSFGEANSALVCQSLCQDDGTCMAFAWSGSTKQCKGYSNLRALNGTASDVTGPKTTCPHVRSVRSTYGNTGRATGTATGKDYAHMDKVQRYEECQSACESDAKCEWFTYNKFDKKCYKKQERGGLNSGKLGDETSPKYVSSDCYLKDVMVSEKVLREIQNAEHAQRCFYECRVSKCAAWSYSEKLKVCTLYTVSGVPSARHHEGVWSGTGNPCGGASLSHVGASGCARKGVKYGGKGFSVEGAADANECQSKCSYAPICQAWTFDARDKKCHLHLAYAEQHKTENTNFISGPKWCVSCGEEHREYVGPADRVFSTGIESSDECQLRCQATDSCQYWSYLVEGICKLFSRKTDTFYSSRTVSAPKFCNWACDMEGFDAPSVGWAGAFQKTVDKIHRDGCREQCLQNKDCKMYVYDVASEKCELKDETPLRELRVQSGKITGFATCSTCFRQGVGYKRGATELLWSLETYSPEECRHRCAVMENCTYFTYDASTKECSLLSGNTGDESGEHLVSGPATCDNPSTACFLNNTMLKGNTNILQQKNTSPEECQKLCAKYPTCRFFTVEPNNRWCYLKTGVDGTPITLTEGYGWKSGNKKCLQPFRACNEVNYDYGQGDIYPKAKSTTSAAQCQDWCYEEPQCRVWMLNKTDKICWMKTIKGFQGRTKLTQKYETEAGARLGCAKCLRSGIQYTGTALAKWEVKYETQCQLRCELTNNCNFISYDLNTSWCTLFSTKGTAKPAGAHVISGPKTC